MSKARTKSFSDKKGNRFIIPSYIIRENDETSMSGSDVILASMMLSQALRGEIKFEDDFMEFDDEVFPHVSTELISARFQHGAATVYLFEGPLFDKVTKELEQ